MATARVVHTLPPVSQASRRLVLTGRTSIPLFSQPLSTTTTTSPSPRHNTPHHRPFHVSAPAAALAASPRTVKPRTAAATARPATTTARTTAAAPKSAKEATAAAALPPIDPEADPLPEAPSQSQLVPEAPTTVDWSSSFHGLSTTPFPADVAAKLMTPLDPEDVEVKPDGILYLPEIKYRRILNAAFGPGGWGLAPRSDLTVSAKVVSREYALVVHGRLVGVARGECPYFGGEDGVTTAGEGSKSNALMRCCKDLGVASELWDPRFIRTFKAKHAREAWVEHVVSKQKRKIWLRKDCAPTYPYQLSTGSASKPVR